MHVYMDQAYPLAKRWSPGARLLHVSGHGPEVKDLPGSEENWRFVFGSPEKKDQTLYLNFRDGAVTRNDEELRPEWFKDCAPIDVLFLDSVKIEELADKWGLGRHELGERGFVLYRPLGEGCQAAHTKHVVAAGDRLAGKAMWVVTGPEASQFIDAKTGKRLARFPRK